MPLKMGDIPLLKISFYDVLFGFQGMPRKLKPKTSDFSIIIYRISGTILL
jgi:hypothetical protein